MLDEERNRALPLDVVRRAPVTIGASAARRSGVLGKVAWVCLGVALLGGGIVLGRRSSSPTAPTTVSTTNLKTDRVVGLGKILPISGVITISPPYGAGDARIATMKVKEGDRVAEGALLSVLDNERTLLGAVDAARAQVGARSATQSQVTRSVLASRAELEAQIARAEIAAQNATRELERVEALLKSGSVSVQAYDQQRATRDEALREVERLRASLSRYGTGSVYAQADAVVAGRNIETAKVDLARATADLDKAYVRAPLAGTVLTIHAEPGERPGSLGIMTMGDLEHMKVEVEVYQTHIGRVAVGDAVTVAAPSLERPLHGTVSKIGLEVGRQQSIDPSPAANTDARVVKVTVALDSESTALARRFTNLQVTAEFASGGAR